MAFSALHMSVHPVLIRILQVRAVMKVRLPRKKRADREHSVLGGILKKKF